MATFHKKKTSVQQKLGPVLPFLSLPEIYHCQFSATHDANSTCTCTSFWREIPYNWEHLVKLIKRNTAFKWLADSFPQGTTPWPLSTKETLLSLQSDKCLEQTVQMHFIFWCEEENAEILCNGFMVGQQLCCATNLSSEAAAGDWEQKFFSLKVLGRLVLLLAFWPKSWLPPSFFLRTTVVTDRGAWMSGLDAEDLFMTKLKSVPRLGESRTLTNFLVPQRFVALYYTIVNLLAKMSRWCKINPVWIWQNTWLETSEERPHVPKSRVLCTKVIKFSFWRECLAPDLTFICLRRGDHLKKDTPLAPISKHKLLLASAHININHMFLHQLNLFWTITQIFIVQLGI